MNPIDYSKALQREREFFRETINKDRQLSEKRAAEREEIHKNVQKKQTNTFVEDKTELQKNYSNNIEQMRKKSQEVMHEKNLAYQKQLAQEREAFQEESQSKTKDFDQRLNEIRSSYRSAFETEKDNHDQIRKANHKRYSRNIEDLTQSTDKKIQDYQGKVEKIAGELKDQSVRERRRMENTHEEQVRDIYKNESNKKAELKERVSDEIAQSRNIYESDLKNVRDFSQQQTREAEEQAQDRVDKLARDYSKLTDELAQKQRLDTIKTNREHEEDLAETRRGFLSELRFQDLKNRQSNRPDLETEGLRQKMVQENHKSIADSKFKRLNEQMVEVKNEASKRMGDNKQAFDDTLKIKSSEASSRMEKALTQLNNEKDLVISKERDKKLVEVEKRDNQNRNSTLAYERQLMLERNAANERIKKLKESFNSSFKALEERSQENIAVISRTSSNDKSEFMKQVQESRNNEVYEMKREFNRLMDQTVGDYEKRLAEFQKNYETMKNTLELKLQTVIDETDKELESHRKLFEDRRTADLRAHQLVQDQKDKSHKQALDTLNISYDKRMSQMVADHEAKLKLITNDYENKLKVLVATSSKELNEKDMGQQIELQRTKMAYEDEKARIINQYENQLHSLKLAHREQLDQLKEFNRLS